MTKDKLKTILYITLFAIIILIFITGVYKFKPESMNPQSILFADSNTNNSSIEEFDDTTTSLKPLTTFYKDDKQPVYNATDVKPKITTLSDSIDKYKTEVTRFNNINNDENLKVYQPYDDINKSITSSINKIKTNIINPKITEQSIITNKIKDLNDKLLLIENKLKKDKILEPEITTAQNIKSLDNGMELSVYYDYDNALYNISVNNGCLSTSNNDYVIEPCKKSNIKQQFEMVNIFNDVEYAKNISPVYESINISNDKGINYPFVMMKSVNNFDCLTNNHGDISVQPCNISKTQRWIPLQSTSGKCATI